ncbi:hypothetical protein MJA45_02700 [Paenibacillus aurantius]|uniref:Uncharacterized protein n=1 Tax=Paenibacillus aurantius TaxID=2918900 RepID=A0AA96LI86_9BACL|nr:hypothetical protein [Paenibacillus aurantius]WNQ11987.1 hypothetical protein MJA45_02700 [Paenibacillus aurantius]
MNFEDKFIYHVDRENGVLSWQVREMLTVEDALKAGELIKLNLATLDQAKLLVDNRFMHKNGRPLVFTPEVNTIWEGVQGEVLPKVTKCSVLCSGAIMKMQMDRIARASGMIEVLKSFWNDDNDTMKKEAYQFLGIASNELVDAHSMSVPS